MVAVLEDETTLLEVDGWEYTRLHEDNLFASVDGRDDFVSHLAVDIYLIFGELCQVRGTISISRIISS